MPTDSFSWWLVSLAIAIGSLSLAIVSGEWLFAFGALVSIGLLMMNELAGTSTEEGSAEEMPLVFPPESLTTGPLHDEEELGGSKS
jgi:hypothetical protein